MNAYLIGPFLKELSIFLDWVLGYCIYYYWIPLVF